MSYDHVDDFGLKRTQWVKAHKTVNTEIMPDASIQYIQEHMARWHERNFPGAEPYSSLLAIVEEVGELSRAHLKQAQGIRGSKEEWEAELRKEIGDVFVTLAVYAAKRGINLGDAVTERWAVVGKRNWVADPTTGGCKEHGAA